MSLDHLAQTSSNRLRLVDLDHQFFEEKEKEKECLHDDPLEEMLFGVELQRELSRQTRESEREFRSPEAIKLQSQIKKLRFYMNELSLHFQLDE